MKHIYNQETRLKALKRDYMQCQICGSRENWNVHHILYRSEAPECVNCLWNLCSLCQDCHTEVHSDKQKYQPLLLQLVGGEDWYEKIDQTELSDATKKTLNYYQNLENRIGQRSFIEL